jgi:23S rRNA pseudouridine2605 synthase
MAKKPSKPKTSKTQSAKPEIAAAIEAGIPAIQQPIQDPIGDETDGEAQAALEPAPGSETEAEIKAVEDQVETETEKSPEAESEPEFTPQPRPPAKLERLQKILAQAGVASRRKAEEMIEQGRVQVNGKIVTELGTKADSARDHIRVDGKLLQGAERLRYFVLNKPKGFVTTVKDPEGRPTVMQFFDKMRERLYPVGRLDYMSEGLLLVTNDGELANRLTRAAAGVEKTYLVKVAGQPSEAELDILRGGVAIERGKPGSPQVRTSPARIRQVRQGDNPWYEVVLIEGRNRELRKMFEQIGHFVEKIRRVGYGPLVLDQEPGNLRELDPQELELLRKAADGKLRTPKSKELRRRNAADAARLPTLAPRPSRPRPAQPFANRAGAGGDDRPRKFFGAVRPDRSSGEGYRSAPPAGKGYRPAAGRPADRAIGRSGDRPRRPYPDPGKAYGDRPSTSRTYGAKPAAGRDLSAKPAWSKPGSSGRPPYNRPPAPRSGAATPTEDFATKRPSRLQIDAVGPDRPSSSFPSASRPRTDRPNSTRPSSSGRSGPGRPFRGEGGLSRPFTSSSGKPRAGGARPSNKSGKPAGRPFGAGSQRPFEAKPTGPAKRPFRRDEAEGSFAPRGQKKTGWKPKPSFGGPPKPASSARSKPGGFSNSGYKGKPSGPRRAGARPSGKRPGGAPGGKKQG